MRRDKMVGYEEQVRPVEILLVEDNPADVRLISETFKDFKSRNVINFVKDGAEAMDFLRKRGAYAGMPVPDIIILDLNLPKKTGFEILEEIKKDPGLKQIPVVVLSTSDSDNDIAKAYQLQAACYVTKPVGLDDFIKAVKNIENFWLNTVKLPYGK
jgi:two-component system, chemotaxis family, response regulator Rcp1